VGCGYHAYTWPVNKQGGTDPAQNVFKTDLSKQQYPETEAWYSPSMYNIVQQDGQCEVNSGLGSVRGARMAEMSYSRAPATQQQRLTQPMVFRTGQMQPTSWDDALDLVARVTVAMLKEPGGEDNLFVSAFDHRGAGGGYENIWGTGKLYFETMKVKKHPHPQSPSLQLRGARDARYGRG
jgi:arsenite oxidase large subunit